MPTSFEIGFVAITSAWHLLIDLSPWLSVAYWIPVAHSFAIPLLNFVYVANAELVIRSATDCSRRRHLG